MPEAGISVPAGQVVFAPVPVPGASSVTLHGGVGSVLPTAMTSLLDPASCRVLPHTHTPGVAAIAFAVGALQDASPHGTCRSPVRRGRDGHRELRRSASDLDDLQVARGAAGASS